MFVLITDNRGNKHFINSEHIVQVYESRLSGETEACYVIELMGNKDIYISKETFMSLFGHYFMCSDLALAMQKINERAMFHDGK